MTSYRSTVLACIVTAISVAPPATAQFEDFRWSRHLQSAEVTLPEPVAVAGNFWQSGTKHGHTARTWHTPLSGKRRVMGWTGKSGTAHATVIYDMAIDRTYSFGNAQVMGLWGHEDESFAVLLKRSNEMFLERYTSDGELAWSTSLKRGNKHPTMDGIGDSRLAYGEDSQGVGRYVAYFTVKDGPHSMDQREFISEDGVMKPEDTWGKGCSHSVAQLVSHHPLTNQFAVICNSDDKPGVGLYAHGGTNIFTLGGSSNGQVFGDPGQLAMTSDGWLLSFNAIERPASPTARGIGIRPLDPWGLPTGPTVWLTDEDGTNVRDSIIARIGTEDAPELDLVEHYLVGWRTFTKPADWKLGIIDREGKFLVQPQNVKQLIPHQALIWGTRNDGVHTGPDGDITWDSVRAIKRDILRLARFSMKAPPLEVDVRALEAAGGTELVIDVTPNGEPMPKSLDWLHVAAVDANGDPGEWFEYANLKVVGGKVTLLTEAAWARGTDLRVWITHDGRLYETSPTVKLRPDLTVAGLKAPESVIAGMEFTLEAVVTEQGLDSGATVDVVLSERGVELDRVESALVDAAGSISVVFSATVTQPGVHRLAVNLELAEPADSDSANDALEILLTARPPMRSMTYSLDYSRYDLDEATGWFQKSRLGDAGMVGSGTAGRQGTFESFTYLAKATGKFRFPLDRLVVQVWADGEVVETVDRKKLKAQSRWKSCDSSGCYRHRRHHDYDSESGRSIHITTRRPRVGTTHVTVGYSRYAGDYVYFAEGHAQQWGTTQSWDINEAMVSGTSLSATESIAIDVRLEDGDETVGGRATATVQAVPDDRQQWSECAAMSCYWGFSNITNHVTAASAGATAL